MRVGRVRRALEHRLLSLGWKLAPGHEIIGALGGNRRWAYLDDTTVCWEVFVLHDKHATHFPIHMVSYDTMSACARGCVVGNAEDQHLVYCHAKEGARGSKVSA